ARAFHVRRLPAPARGAAADALRAPPDAVRAGPRRGADVRAARRTVPAPFGEPARHQGAPPRAGGRRPPSPRPDRPHRGREPRRARLDHPGARTPSVVTHAPALGLLGPFTRAPPRSRVRGRE